jgi:outer membrane lipoprotein-sorting protein
MVADGIKSLGLKEEGSAEGQRRFVMEKEGNKGSVIFDAETWFLISGEMNSEEGRGTVTASDTAKVKEWPEGTFTFTAAEGVVVTDLTSMLEMQMGAMGGQEEEEDLEF